ncbi:MAG: hypothetical protein D6815_12430, partial [Candidatus Dadabacteria bacterium]
VEVVVARRVPTFFMRVLGKEAVEVEARAVAGLVDRNIGVYAIDPSQKGALTVAKGARVDIPECDVFVNSQSRAAALAGAGARLTAGRVEVVGGYEGDGFYPDPETGASQIADPLEDLPAPSYSGCDHYGTVTVRGKRRLRPGVYCGGIDVVDDGQLVLESGVYVLRGGGLRVGKQCEPQELPKSDHGDSDHGESDHGDSEHASASHGDSDHGASDHGDSDHTAKVTVCHVSGSREQTLEVEASALATHLAHGDSLGKCSNLCEASADHGDSDHGESEHGDSDHGGSDHASSDHGDSASAGKAEAKVCHPAIRGTGVTIYVTDGPHCGYGPVEIDPSASVDLSAPTSGPLAGVLFFQDRRIASGPASTLAVDGSDAMTGVAYFPTTAVHLVGGKLGAAQEMKIVANKVGFEGRLLIDCPANNGPYTPSALKRVALSE